MSDYPYHFDAKIVTYEFGKMKKLSRLRSRSDHVAIDVWKVKASEDRR